MELRVLILSGTAGRSTGPPSSVAFGAFRALGQQSPQTAPRIGARKGNPAPRYYSMEVRFSRQQVCHIGEYFANLAIYLPNMACLIAA
jgi:hypothetical protein